MELHGEGRTTAADVGSKIARRTSAATFRQRGLLFHQEQYLHDTHFCWRAEEDPLINIRRRSWFVRTTQYKDRMLANNQHINWLPEHIKEGRFGNFLETNRRLGPFARALLGHALPIWVARKLARWKP